MSGLRHWNLLFLFFYWLVGSCEGFLFGNKNGTRTTTPTPTTEMTSMTSSMESLDHHWERNMLKAEAGTIAGVVFGVLVSMVLIATVGIMYIRRKRQRDAAYRRELQVQKMSAESAGVYRETTSNQNIYKPTNSGKKKYTSMQKNSKDPNMYETDSEDELWTK